MKTALVLGAGGFIGSHMVKRLRADGYWVRGVDLKYPEFSETEAIEFNCQEDTCLYIFVSSRGTSGYDNQDGRSLKDCPSQYIYKGIFQG